MTNIVKRLPAARRFGGLCRRIGDAVMNCPDIAELDQYVLGDRSSACDPSLRDHVESCADCQSRLSELKEHHQLEHTVRRVLERTAQLQPDTVVPHSSGQYRVLRELGRGGMGIVYEAQQESPRRRVALKLLNLAAGTDEGQARVLQRESRALARLQHPSIAAIYDAGQTPDGRAFFAMELVEGVPLTEFARNHRLTVTQRIELFAGVCETVAYAHQRGVIHRDLKPSNILVVEEGTEARLRGSPKILDFGLARVLDTDADDSSSTAGSLFTEAGRVLGTLPYMSPEHVRGVPHDIDVRSDVYSLGVVLYELLTGHLPYTIERGNLPQAARVIAEQAPARPRGIDAEVETVVLKALEKSPERRYQSAAELAADLRRILRNEPIAARPPGAWYQFRKFARRNRLVVATIAAAIVLLTAAAIVSTWQAIRARTAEQFAEAEESEARQEAAKSRAVIDFLQEMFAAADPTKTPDQPELTVKQALHKAVAKLDEGQLKDQPEIEVAVRGTIGNTYRALGDVAAAEPQLRWAVETGRQIYPDGHSDLAYALNKQARLLGNKGEYEPAEKLYGEALEMYRGLYGEEHAEVAKMMNNLGELMRQRGRYDEAESLHRRALAMRQKLLGEEHTDIATSLNNLALVMDAKGDERQAAALLRQSLAMDRKLRGDLHPNIASTMSNLATVLMDIGEVEEAETLLRDALDQQRRIHGTEHQSIAICLNNLALVLRKKGELDEAERLYREALDMHRKLRGERHPEVATAVSNLAVLLLERGKMEEAESHYRLALDIRRERLGPDHPYTLASRYHLAGFHLTLKQYDQAAAILGDAVARAQALPPRHRLKELLLTHYGECLMKLERWSEAEAPLLEVHGLLKEVRGEQDPATRKVAEQLVQVYEAQGREDRADAYREMSPSTQASANPE